MGWSRAQIVRVAKRTGFKVVESWSRHNAGTMGTIYGPMLHHTATPEYVGGDYPTLRIVRDGRPGLENSLCMYGIGRSGTIYCINDKISWHAGEGYWRGVRDGNGNFAGIEAEGPYRSWPKAELEAYERLTASILLEARRGIEWAPTHAQWALPRGRKSDPYGFDLTRFRGNVQRYLNNPALLGTAGGVEELNAEQEKILRQIASFARSTNNELTAGEPGVKFAGDVWTKVTQARDGVAALRSQAAAQQTTINKLVELLAAKQSLDVAAVRKAVTDAIAANIVKVDVTVDDNTP